MKGRKEIKQREEEPEVEEGTISSRTFDIGIYFELMFQHDQLNCLLSGKYLI